MKASDLFVKALEAEGVLLDKTIATDTQKVAEATQVLKDVKIGTKSSLGTTLVDVSGKPIDMSTFAGRNKFFKQADWGDWLKQWGPEGAEKLKEMVEIRFRPLWSRFLQ